MRRLLIERTREEASLAARMLPVVDLHAELEAAEYLRDKNQNPREGDGYLRGGFVRCSRGGGGGGGEARSNRCQPSLIFKLVRFLTVCGSRQRSRSSANPRREIGT